MYLGVCKKICVYFSMCSLIPALGSVLASKLENYISFHESLLGFYETFVVVYRVPVFSLLWSLLRQLEPQVRSQQARSSITTLV